MKPTLYTATGECVTPGRELGKGGEGAVYDIEEFADSVAKIYHTPPPALKQDKLAFMAATADAQLLNYVAWPQATLHGGRGGKVIGFMMPKVSGKEPIHMIYSPAHRRQSYPHCAWDFLLYVARNIASSFATVHEHGHVVGELPSLCVGFSTLCCAQYCFIFCYGSRARARRGGRKPEQLYGRSRQQSGVDR